jgi:hypothetical protein
MYKVITFFDLISIVAGLILLLRTFYNSESLFIKARTRDVREILTKNVIKFETSVRIKLAGKFAMGNIFLAITISRIKEGCVYISTADFFAWQLLCILFLIIAVLDFRYSSPENED